MNDPISLTKEMTDEEPADLTGVDHFRLGVSWETSSQGKGRLLGAALNFLGTDLDGIAVPIEAGGAVTRLAGLDSLDAFDDGAITHSGDNKTGKASGDDEVISVDFRKVIPDVEEIVFVVAAYKKGSSFDKANKVTFTLYDATGGNTQAMATIRVPLGERGNAMRVAKAVRQADGRWGLRVLNQMGSMTQGDQRSLLNFARS